jgi:hypothetical protein
MRVEYLTTRFVELMPSDLESGTLYVSMEYATVIHLCCCGCGNRAVTPLSPAGWSLRYNGDGISLTPSIGNGSFFCRSHYWIVDSRVEWLPQLPADDIDRARRRDREAQLALETSGSGRSSTQKDAPSKIAILFRRIQSGLRR